MALTSYDYEQKEKAKDEKAKSIARESRKINKQIAELDAKLRRMKTRRRKPIRKKSKSRLLGAARKEEEKVKRKLKFSSTPEWEMIEKEKPHRGKSANPSSEKPGRDTCGMYGAPPCT